MTPGSLYKYLAAEYLERGCSPALTAYFVNIHLRDDRKNMTVSERCIVRLKESLDLLITKIRKKPQSRSQHLDWVHARHNWVLQLLIRMGYLTPTEEDFRENKIPKWCNIENLKEDDFMFNLHQVVFLTKFTKNKLQECQQ